MHRRAGRRCFSDFPAATSGRDGSRIGQRPSAISAIRNSLVQVARAAANSKEACELAAAVLEKWPRGDEGTPYVVCTGGEPLLQLDEDAVHALHQAGFEIGVETNGTIKAPAGIDWICVSPKAGAGLLQLSGNELKLVYPQAEDTAQPERFTELNFGHFFLQPLDNAQKDKNTRAAIEYCIANPRWRLSLQTHKLIGIP